jgi:hypothetical protein
MNRQIAVRWWPPIGLLAMVALGLVVGRGSTRLDDWFIRAGEAHEDLGRLLVFTDGRVTFAVWAIVLATAVFQRRWRVGAVVFVSPFAAVAAARVCKGLFGRDKDGTLAYPSGHVTLAVVVLGMAVLVAGVAAWAVLAAAVVAVLGVFGQAFTYHYFTDTIGALLLATALVCLAVPMAGLDRCQTRLRSASH